MIFKILTLNKCTFQLNRLLVLSLCMLAISVASCKKQEPVIDTPIPIVEDTLTYGTPFQNVPATEDIVMYEVNERAYSISGDFRGITDRIDSIKALGINVIWLMPIHPIGTIQSVNSPYSVQNYKEVNPEFGDLSELRTLVDSAHSRNMAVILDWVANHTAWDNPWISNTSWYSQDGAGNIIIPPGTNWQDVADLNFDNADMRLAMIDAMKYWILTANIDGFRCDAADMVPFEFWQQAIDSLNHMPGRKLIFLAEGARADHFTAGFQLNFSWDFYGGLKNVWSNGYAASTLFTIHSNEYLGLPAGAEKLRFTTNHDESAWDATPFTLFNGADGALAASVITSYLGGVPLIYSSQEVGRSTTVPFFTKSPINWNSHPEMLQAYKSIFSFYNASNALRKGSLTTFPNSNVVCFRKNYQAEEVYVIVNTRNYAFNYILPAEVANATWKNAFDNTDITLANAVVLNAYQYLVIRK